MERPRSGGDRNAGGPSASLFGTGLLWCLLLASGCRAVAPATGTAPGAIRLPVLGTVGDAPPEGGRLVVEVDARGRISVEGEVLDASAYRDLLRNRADATREDEPPGASRLRVVFRLDRDLPWPVVTWLIGQCTAPRVRMYGFFFAALPEDGGPEGAFCTFVTEDATGRPIPATRPFEIPLSVEESHGGPAASPEALHGFLRERLASRVGRRSMVMAEVRGNVATGDVLALVDACVRFGSECVVVTGEDAGAAADPEGIVASLPARRPGLALTVLGARVPPLGGEFAGMPPLPRVRGRCAGTFCSVGTGAYELPYGLDHEEEEKVIETPIPDEADPPVKGASK